MICGHRTAAWNPPVSPGSTPGSRVWVYAQNARVATMQETATRLAVPELPGGLSTRALTRHECPDVLDRPRVQHVRWFDPAAAGRADAELHLAGETVDAVAIAVDRDGDAGGCRLARDLAVHVEVPGCAVHFHRRSRFGRGGEQPLVVEAVPVRSAGSTIGRVRDDVYQRIADGLEIPLSQTCLVVAPRFVQRCQDDVEACQQIVVEVEAPVGHDVHFDAVENLDAANTGAKGVDFLTLFFHLAR